MEQTRGERDIETRRHRVEAEDKRSGEKKGKGQKAENRIHRKHDKGDQRQKRKRVTETETGTERRQTERRQHT